LKRFTLFVKVLKTGFDGVAVTGKTAGGILADSVGKVIVSGLFVAASHIEMTPIDVIAGRVKGLSLTSCKLQVYQVYKV